MNNKELISHLSTIKFAKKISPAAILEMVRVETDTSSIKSNCFENVAIKVKNNGGKITYGWQVHPYVINNVLLFVEAEAHAIWLSDKNNKMCVSPQEDKEIIFLEDHNKLIENNHPIPNFRLPIIQSPELSKMIKILEIQDITKIKLRNYIISKIDTLNEDNYPKISFDGKNVLMEYNNNISIIEDEEFIKLYLLSIRIQNIKKNHLAFDLNREICNLCNELNYRCKYLIKI